MRRIAVLLGFSVAVMLVVFGLTSTLYSQAAGGERIGVVDFAKIMKGFNKYGRLAAEHKTETARSLGMLGEKAEEIAKLEESLKTLKEWGKKYTQVRIEIAQKTVEHRALVMSEQAKLNEMALDMARKLMEDIRQVVSDYGRAKGYTIIVKREDLPAPVTDGDPLVEYIRQSSVLYHTQGMDLTADILNLLNQKFK
jgi:Skp family chaperone for outer membrane proteins